MKPIHKIRKLLGIKKRGATSIHCKNKQAWPVGLFNYWKNENGTPQNQYLCECGGIYFKGVELGDYEISFGVDYVISFLKLQFQITSDPNRMDGINKIHQMLSGKPFLTKMGRKEQKKNIVLLIDAYKDLNSDEN